MIWQRWRERQRRADDPLLQPMDPFEDLLEDAPVVTLLLDRDNRVLAANQSSRTFFRLEGVELPLGLVEATREARLLQVLRAGSLQGEVRLSHCQRTVQYKLAPGPQPDDTLIFLVDVTELRRLETVRQEFVANLSHELRTPLTSLRLAVESLQGDPPPEARYQFAARALIETDHLSSVVTNLRELAQIEAGQLELSLTRFDVRQLVEETVSREVTDRPLDLRVPDGLEVMADHSKLSQILRNLVDNAVKFSSPGSPIEIEGSIRGGEFVLTVRDHGPGISPEHWTRVFERFYKVDPSRARSEGDRAEGTRATSGSGLGLAITKHLVLAHGGRVWTEAAREGGQIFGVAIPAALDAQATA